MDIVQKDSRRTPRWLWRLILGGTLLVVGSIILVVLLLLGGAADPPLAGPLRWSDQQMVWAPGNLAIDQDVWSTAPENLPAGLFTLRLEARLASGSDPSAAWGVWLETMDGGRVIYAISGERMITTRRCEEHALSPLEDCPAVRPEWRWFEYNRLFGPGKTNAITLHREASGQIRLRLNDERMGVSPVDLSGRWGVWARGGRDGLAVLVWEQAAIYAP